MFCPEIIIVDDDGVPLRRVELDRKEMHCYRCGAVVERHKNQRKRNVACARCKVLRRKIQNRKRYYKNKRLIHRLNRTK